MNAKHAKNLALRGSAVVVTGVAVTIVGGTAFAFWSTAPGSGSGTAAAGQAAALTTTAATASTTSLLYPNGPNGDVKLTVANSNPFAVQVTAVSAGTAAVTAAGGTGTCTTTGVSLITPTGGLPFTVPKNGSITVTLTGAARMDNTSETGCQNATFTIPVSLTGQSVA